MDARAERRSHAGHYGESVPPYRGYPLEGEPTKAERFLREHGLEPADMHDGAWLAWPPRRLIDGFLVRNAYVAKFGFAVLTQAAAERLRPYAPILEVGSGSGYWAWELTRRGIPVVATDPGTGEYRDFGKWKPWTTINRLTALEAISQSVLELTLMLVWPDYDKPWAAEIVRVYRGKHIIYVGEGREGCTADNAFHDLLEGAFVEEDQVAIPVFDSLHDRLWIYRRK